MKEVCGRKIASMSNIIEFTEKVYNYKIPEAGMGKTYVLRSMVAPSYDETYNYEVLELLGDKTMQEYFCLYCLKVLKLEQHPHAVNIITRLNIKYLSGRLMVNLADDLGLPRFILSTGSIDEKIIEDTLEAWVGACRLAYAPAIFERGIFEIFSKIKIRFGYEDLYDPKSIVNDFSSAIRATVQYSGGMREIDPVTESIFYETTIRCFQTDKPQLVLGGRGPTKRDSEQEAASKLLEQLRLMHGPKIFYESLSKVKNYQKWKEFYSSLSGESLPCRPSKRQSAIEEPKDVFTSPNKKRLQCLKRHLPVPSST